MLLLLAAVPAVAYGLFVPEGLIAPFRFDLAGPAAYGFGVLIGAAIGAVQRWAPRHVWDISRGRCISVRHAHRFRR